MRKRARGKTPFFSLLLFAGITLAIAAYFVAIVAPLAADNPGVSGRDAVFALWVLIPTAILAIVSFLFLPWEGGRNA